MSNITLTATIILIIIAGAIATVILYKEALSAKQNGEAQAPTTTNQKSSTTEPATTPQTTTMNQETGERNEVTAWDIAEEFTTIRLMHEPGDQGLPSPVLVNGSLYDFSYAKLEYNYTIGNTSIAYNYTWILKNTSYTASCHDIMNDKTITRSTPNALHYKITYKFTDGYWITVDAYVPANATTAIYYLSTPAPRSLATWATPGAGREGALGAVIHSSDTGSNGEWTSALPLLPEDMIGRCEPIVKGNPSIYSLLDKFNPLSGHDIAMMFMPPDLNDPTGILSTIGKTIELNRGTGAPYQHAYYKITPVGEGEYPGLPGNTTIYNLTFWTQPDYVHGYYIIIAQSIVPLEYHAVFPQGDNQNGTPITITIKLLDAKIIQYKQFNK
ncbi:MAG: hypothetical protein F7C33_03470 [Desulfurococcales archaeon]|nr:hypothetical protein [Desulfurococcales archaeon]